MKISIKFAKLHLKFYIPSKTVVAISDFKVKFTHLNARTFFLQKIIRSLLRSCITIIYIILNKSLLEFFGASTYMYICIIILNDKKINAPYNFYSFKRTSNGKHTCLKLNIHTNRFGGTNLEHFQFDI